MNTRKPWWKSFAWALEGLRFAVRHERNMKIHLVFAALAVLMGWVLDISWIRWLFVFLTISLVLSMELMNTAVEKTVDLVMPRDHPLAKAAKDVSAAAVLMTAIFSVLAGIVLFYEPFMQKFLK